MAQREKFIKYDLSKVVEGAQLSEMWVLEASPHVDVYVLPGSVPNVLKRFLCRLLLGWRWRKIKVRDDGGYTKVFK